MDGNYIPFFITKISKKINTSYIVTLKGSMTETYAKRFVGRELLIGPTNQIIDSKIRVKTHEWEGYTVVKADNSLIGIVKTIVEHNENPLVQIFDSSNREILLPNNSNFIKKIDAKAHVIVVDLPDGFLDLFK
jgi:ribosomal 30S subunit maturation factor RimM